MNIPLLRPKKSTTVRSFLGLAARLFPDAVGRYAADAWGRPVPPADGPRAPSTPGLAAHRFTLTADPYQLAVWDWGEGPTVLLVHGWNGRAAQLEPFVAPLVAAGFSVVAFDQPAHNLSTGTSANLVEMAHAVAVVAEKVRPVHAVIAHSLGATATGLALARGLSVDKAVLIAPPAEVEHFARAFAHQLGVPHAADAMLRHIAGMFGPLATVDQRLLARSQRASMMLLHDPKDREVPFAHGRAIAEAWPGARLQPLYGLGHRRMLKDPSTIHAVVDFLVGDAQQERRTA